MSIKNSVNIELKMNATFHPGNDISRVYVTMKLFNNDDLDYFINGKFFPIKQLVSMIYVKGPSLMPCCIVESHNFGTLEPFKIPAKSCIETGPFVLPCNFRDALPGTYTVAFEKQLILYEDIGLESPIKIARISGEANFDVEY